MQAHDGMSAMFGLGLGLFGCFLFIVLIGIGIAVIYFLFVCLKRIPAEHRRQEPALVWLLLIPLFNFVWSFFVFPKLAESYQSYFSSQGVTDVGDCGRQLSLILCIVACLNLLNFIIPFVGCLIGPVTLVLLILVLLKFNELKNRIPA